jgi:pSer/pThr/pTyr-binding forkhead associated (FHA) protein
MHAQLVPLKGGKTVVISRDVTLVGRQQDLCDLVIERGSVSKIHCLIVRTDGLLFIRDLGSTNGTKVNGQRVIRGALLPGDELAFASERFKVEMGPDVPEPAADIHGAQTEEIRVPGSLLAGLADRLQETADQSDSDVRLIED